MIKTSNSFNESLTILIADLIPRLNTISYLLFDKLFDIILNNFKALYSHKLIITIFIYEIEHYKFDF